MNCQKALSGHILTPGLHSKCLKERPDEASETAAGAPLPLCIGVARADCAINHLLYSFNLQPKPCSVVKYNVRLQAQWSIFQNVWLLYVLKYYFENIQCSQQRRACLPPSVVAIVCLCVCVCVCTVVYVSHKQVAHFSSIS